MTIERVDRLTSPPIVGQFYLVRTVCETYFGKFKDWPVIGPEHDDVEFFGFKDQHYHVDFRFIRCSDALVAERHPYVLHPPRRISGVASPTLAKPVWHRRKCVRSQLGFFLPRSRFIDTSPLYKLRNAFAGRQCARDARGGFICPHRKAPLGSIQPDKDGVITCPLHGLRIDASTGVVVPE